MKLTTLDEDLRIHQKLDDEPNDVGGLTAQALKEKFDQAGVTIQKYLNEVHLPEEERGAAETLAQAKEYTRAYTGQQLKGLGAGDMKAAVYDAKNRKKDVFDYVDEKAAALKTEMSGGLYLCAGKVGTEFYNFSSGDITLFREQVDPDGLWDANEKVFVVPQGARMALIMARVNWCRAGNATCSLQVNVDGTVKAERAGPKAGMGEWEGEHLFMPVQVEGGEKIKLTIKMLHADSTVSYARLRVEDMCIWILK